MNLLLNIDVPDLACAQAFYSAAFALRPARRLGGTVLEMTGLDVPVHLLAKTAGSEGAPASLRDYRRHWTPVHADIVVDDIDAALTRAVAAGATVESGIDDAVRGRIARIADPFGHGWCLIQFLGRGYDEITT